MKTLSIIALLLASLSTFALSTDTKIILDKKEKPVKVINLKYNVDKSGLGRAWISMDVVLS